MRRDKTDLWSMRLADWFLLKSELAWIYEGEVEPQYRNTSNQFPGDTAYLIRQGALEIENEFGTATAGPGEWLMPRQGRRIQRFSNDARILSIRFNICWPGGQPLFRWDVAMVFQSSSVPILEREAVRLWRYVEPKYPHARNMLPRCRFDLPTYLLIHSQFVSWLCIYAETLLDRNLIPERLDHMDPRVLGAVQVLDRWPLATLFSESKLAAKADLSPRQLRRHFVRHFGITPFHYFDRRRLEMAMSQIGGSFCTLKEIAYELGFAGLAHFSRWFRQKTGMSPRQFQRTGLQTFKETKGVGYLG